MPILTLDGDEIAGRPLGATPFTRVEPLIEARLGKPKVGPPGLCRLDGERSPIGMVDYNWPGLTLHTGRRGAVTVVIGWSVDLAAVPEGFRLADRLPWQPTFAVLEATDGVAVSTQAGARTARLPSTAITYSGARGAVRPDTVAGGPGFSC